MTIHLASIYLQSTKRKICTYYFENCYYDGSNPQRQEEATISWGPNHLGTCDNVQIPVNKIRVSKLCIAAFFISSNIRIFTSSKGATWGYQIPESLAPVTPHVNKPNLPLPSRALRRQTLLPDSMGPWA